MTTNTNSAHERTASIDLDAEREAMFAADPEGMEKVKNAGLVHAAMKGWLAARRSLTSDHRKTTSGAPADTRAVRTTVTPGFIIRDYDAPAGLTTTVLSLDAAPVHDAAAPSAEQASYWYRTRPLDPAGRAIGDWSDRIVCSTDEYRSGIKVAAHTEIEYGGSSAGAAAKTEHNHKED